MPAALTIGAFEHLLLLAALRLGEAAYGVSLAREIEARTGRQVSPGAVYTALERLQRRGLVSSRLGEPTAERGGRRKRLYRVTDTGRLALERRHAALARMSHGLSMEPRVG